MTIRYKCEECGAALNIKDDLAGTQGHCPRCQVEFTVPAPEDASVEKKPAAAVGEAVAAGKQRTAGGPISDDEIENILASSGPSSSSDSAYRVPVAGDDANEDTAIEDEPIRGGRRARLDEDATETESDEGGNDEDEAPARSKKKKPVKETKSGGDSAESAAIARGLMGRGDSSQPAKEVKKKAGRPFGSRDDGREEGDEFTAREVATSLIRQFWPYAAGAIALCTTMYLIMWSMTKKVALPNLAPVSGTVTLDGKPLAGAEVQFWPRSEGGQQSIYVTTSFGVTDDQGKYLLKYTEIDSQPIMGAVVGKHTVRISKLATQNVNREVEVEGKKVKEQMVVTGELLSSRYCSSKSELSADVKKGGGPYDFKLTSEEQPGEAKAGGIQTPP